MKPQHNINFPFNRIRVYMTLHHTIHSVTPHQPTPHHTRQQFFPTHGEITRKWKLRQKCSYVAIYNKDLNRHDKTMHTQSEFPEVFGYSTQHRDNLREHVQNTHTHQSRVFYSSFRKAYRERAYSFFYSFIQFLMKIHAFLIAHLLGLSEQKHPGWEEQTICSWV